jgi:hypothetical protein
MQTPVHTCTHQQDNKQVHVYTYSRTYTPRSTCTHLRDTFYTPEYVYTRTNQTNVYVNTRPLVCVLVCTLHTLILRVYIVHHPNTAVPVSRENWVYPPKNQPYTPKNRPHTPKTWCIYHPYPQNCCASFRMCFRKLMYNLFKTAFLEYTRLFCV